MMRTLPDQSVHTCITSPPYFGLRDYGVDGQIGLEASPREFIESLVAVFREVRRVLRNDGTLWVNLGDSYASGTKGSGGTGKSTLGAASGGNGISEAGILRSQQRQAMNARKVDCGLADKQLIGIPWRLAFALQADGWYLRQDIIWHKPKPVSWMRFLIATYTNPGQVVLDNTMGSGTTGVACIQLGRRFVGIEQDEAHFGTAQQRIAEAITIRETPAAQIDLFEARA
ncbi:site-specific DNA-methyltransferase [Pseudomonas sp. p1(2021b)]|nr:site-specific DNA-methyltransferase [Pseudomonas sp. p1(2021b)]